MAAEGWDLTKFVIARIWAYGHRSSFLRQTALTGSCVVFLGNVFLFLSRISNVWWKRSEKSGKYIYDCCDSPGALRQSCSIRVQENKDTFWFLPPFEHPCHLKSGIPPLGTSGDSQLRVNRRLDQQMGQWCRTVCWPIVGLHFDQ